MRPHHKHSFFLFFALSALAAGALLIGERGFSRDGIRQERLFTITRNINDNMVCYDARVRESKLDAEEPIKVYWIIPKKNNATEELTRVERKRAYGFEIVRAFGADSVDIKLKPLPRAIRVKKIDGKWVAITSIDSVQAILKSAYVMADSTGLIPNVQWVRMNGVDLHRGSEVMETLKP